MKQTAQSILRTLMASLASDPAVEPITGIIGFLDMCQGIGVEPDLWDCQNAWYDLYRSHASAAGPDSKLSRGLRQLGERLGFTTAP